MSDLDEAVGLIRELRDALGERLERLEQRLGRLENPPGTGFVPADVGAQGRPGGSRRGVGAELGLRDSFSGWVADSDLGARPSEGEFSLGRLIRSMVTGDRSGLSDLERQAQTEGSDSAGGVLVPPAQAGTVIDLVRSQTRVLEAGARTIPMGSDVLAWPRLVGGSDPEWLPELAPFGDTSLAFDKVVFDAKTCRVRVKLSEELFEDSSPAADAVISTEVTAALAAKLDWACLRGSGIDPEPRGIRNTAGVHFMGAPPATIADYDFLAACVGAVRGSNFTPNAALYTAALAGQLDVLKDTAKQPLVPPASVAGLAQLVSNEILDAGGAPGEAYVAQWDQVLIGVRPTVGVRVRMIDASLADDFSISLVAWLRADVQLARAEAFAVTAAAPAALMATAARKAPAK